MSVVLLSEFAYGLADGSEFVVEDLEQNMKLTYVVWKGVAYIRKEQPACTVRDFHDDKDWEKMQDFKDSNELVIYNDQVWIFTQGDWALWNP